MPRSKKDEIIERCLRNDRVAQKQLYELCFEDLMRVCVRYFNQREEAVAVLNEGFLKILLSLKEYSLQGSFENWTRTIVIRTCIDEYRKKKKYVEMIEPVDNYDSVEAEFKPVYNQVIENLSQSEVDKILETLNGHERFVFSLYEFEGYTHDEIAAQLGVSIRSSKRYLQRAKLKLRDQLEKKIESKTEV